MLTKQIGQATYSGKLNMALVVSAADTDAVQTIAAAPGKKHLIHAIQWSYSGDPTTGRLTVSIASVDKFDVDITMDGPSGFGIELVGGVNEAIVITLAAGGADIVGKLNVQYTTESDTLEHVR